MAEQPENLDNDVELMNLLPAPPRFNRRFGVVPNQQQLAEHDAAMAQWQLQFDEVVAANPGILQARERVEQWHLQQRIRDEMAHQREIAARRRRAEDEARVAQLFEAGNIAAIPTWRWKSSMRG